MPARPVTVCIKGVRGPLLAASVKTGRSVEELARPFGLTEALLFDPAARVPHAVVVRLWESLAGTTGDPDFGLFAAQLTASAVFDLLDLTILNAASVADLAEFFFRYQRLFHDANASHLAPGPGYAAVVLALEGELERSDQLVEFILANWLLRLHRAVGVAFAPRRVSFRHAPRGPDALPRAVFGCEVTYGADRDALELSDEVMRLPLAQGNAVAHAQLRAQLDALAPMAGRGVVAELEPVVRELVLVGRGSLAHAAARLAVSERSLQRRLQEEGTRYSEVLDRVRHQLALTQLQRGNTVTDVAFALDFSDVSSFIRAFRRWTGRSPTAWLKAQ